MCFHTSGIVKSKWQWYFLVHLVGMFMKFRLSEIINFQQVYPRKNTSWTKSLKQREFIYVEFISKKEFHSLENVFKFHEENSEKNFPGVEFDYFEDIEEWFQNPYCKRLVLRVGYYPQYIETETTIFLDFGTFIAYYVLTTPTKNRDQNHY